MFGQVQVTKEINPADVTVRVHFDAETGKPEMRVLAKGLGLQRVPLDDAESELVALLVRRALGLEQKDRIVVMSSAEAEAIRAPDAELERELEQVKAELAAAVSEAPDASGVDAAPPHELPAIAQRISDGASVEPGEVERFVVGVFEAAADLGDEVAGRAARVLDFVARELAPIVKDVPPPTPPDKPAPAPRVPAPAQPRPAAARAPTVVPAIPPPVRLSPTAQANLEFLKRKKEAQQELTPEPTEPSSELRAVADKVLRGEVLDLGELQRFVEACRFVTLDEQMSNAFTEAQDHLKSLEA